MVTFNEDMGYREAMTIGRAQDKAILNMIADQTINTNEDLSKTKLKMILDQILKETETIIEEDRLAKTMHY
jgi:kynurenine 3-monooxygenase